MDRKCFLTGFLLGIGIVSSGLLQAASFYTSRPDDPAAVYLTKESFPVHGDGTGDDSDAIQQAIDRVASSTGAGILLIPKGTYRLSKTIYVWPGIRLIGYGDSRPLMMLAANSPGFQEGTGKYLFFFSGGPGRGGDGQPQDGNPGTFYSAMSNLDIEIGPGNSAAIGIRFHVAQHCYLSHMDFRLGSARAGLEDIGNEVEDLHFIGGQFGIATRRAAPGWPILIIDCTFEGQSEAAIQSDEAGLTIVRPCFTNVPTAVSIVPGKPDELWISDGRMENISGPAVIISNERNARTQINLQNIACTNVSVLAKFRDSGRIFSDYGSSYVITYFSHGLQLGDAGGSRQVKPRAEMRQVSTLPAAVASDIPRLPDGAEWVNVRTVGVVGNGKADDTAAFRAAIAKYRVLYLPTGWYCVSDTLNLRPDTVLIGLNPSTTVVALPEGAPAFGAGGDPKAAIEAPKGGRNILMGFGVYTGAVNPCAVGIKWMAGPDSLINDVRLHGGHGTRIPGDRSGFGRLGYRDAWNNQHASLWVTEGGGGTFKDIWTPSPYAAAGMEISNTLTSGRVYAISLEHHVRNEMIIRNVSNWRFYAVQFEEEREEGPKALPLQIDRSSNLQFANTFFYRVISCFVPFPQAVKVSESKDVRFRNLHCYSNSRVSFDSSVMDTTAGAEIRDPEFAALDLSGKPLAKQATPGMSLFDKTTTVEKRVEDFLDLALASSSVVVFDAGAKVEKLADGFLNIAGAAVDSKGTLYFADARENRIYRWLPDQRRAELVREIQQQPVQLAFDKSDNLLVVAYSGNGTIVSFRPEAKNSPITTLVAQPAMSRPSAMAVLPVNRWMHNAEFMQNSTQPKPAHFVSPDGSIFIPADREFTTGAMQWGIKMADVLRAFRLAPTVPGRRFYVTNELELKTWSFTVGPDGTLSDPKLFVEEGGEGVTTDERGNVYIAAGRIRVFDPAGKPLDVLDVPQRPTCLVFGGPDRKLLFITARSSLYSIPVHYSDTAGSGSMGL